MNDDIQDIIKQIQSSDVGMDEIQAALDKQIELGDVATNSSRYGSIHRSNFQAHRTT